MPLSVAVKNELARVAGTGSTVVLDDSDADTWRRTLVGLIEEPTIGNLASDEITNFRNLEQKLLTSDKYKNDEEAKKEINRHIEWLCMAQSFRDRDIAAFKAGGDSADMTTNRNPPTNTATGSTGGASMQRADEIEFKNSKGEDIFDPKLLINLQPLIELYMQRGAFQRTNSLFRDLSYRAEILRYGADAAIVKPAQWAGAVLMGNKDARVEYGNKLLKAAGIFVENMPGLVTGRVTGALHDARLEDAAKRLKAHSDLIDEIKVKNPHLTLEQILKDHPFPEGAWRDVLRHKQTTSNIPKTKLDDLVSERARLEIRFQELTGQPGYVPSARDIEGFKAQIGQEDLEKYARFNKVREAAINKLEGMNAAERPLYILNPVNRHEFSYDPTRQYDLPITASSIASTVASGVGAAAVRLPAAALGAGMAATGAGIVATGATVAAAAVPVSATAAVAALPVAVAGDISVNILDACRKLAYNFALGTAHLAGKLPNRQIYGVSDFKPSSRFTLPLANMMAKRAATLKSMLPARKISSTGPVLGSSQTTTNPDDENTSTIGRLI